MKKIHVAVAVILNSQNQVFLTKRSQDVDQAGLWEFPGGKLEVGETSEDALKRELQEEVGIEINQAKSFLSIPFNYPSKTVLLDVFIVSDYSKEPWGKEGQISGWFELDQLASMDFPEANTKIVEKLMREYSC